MKLADQHISFSIMILTLITSLGLLPFAAGGPRAVCQTQPIKVEEGEDAVLQCRLDPPVDLSANTLDFKRDDNNQEVVYSYRDGRDYFDPQMERYRGRTTLLHEALSGGVVNLTISSVSLSDNGTYKFFVPRLKVGCALHLIVEKKETKTNVSCTTGPAVEEVTESDDRGAANREAGRAAVYSVVVFLLLVVLVVLLDARRRERLETSRSQDGAAGGGLLNVSEGK